MEVIWLYPLYPQHSIPLLLLMPQQLRWMLSLFLMPHSIKLHISIVCGRCNGPRCSRCCSFLHGRIYQRKNRK